VIVSNHFHLLLSADNVKSLASFMCHLNGNLARELGRLHGWNEKFWARRYAAIPVLDDGALIDRVKYLLAHGVKENLVERCGDWPGPNCVRALTEGKPLTGVWFRRSLEYRARRRQLEFDEHTFSTTYEIPLTPVSCWKDATQEQQRSYVREIISEIEQEARAKREEDGKGVLGAKLVREQSPHGRPRKTKRSPAPLCHCKDPKVREKFMQMYRQFILLLLNAAERLRKGERDVKFPPCCFPPRAAFVTDSGAALAPI
jgi:hypothetical protein